MADELLIYVIVLFNALVQLALIHGLDIPVGNKRKYYGLAVAIPVLVMASMRLSVYLGLIHGHVADQGFLERYATDVASVMLVAGPWLATLGALRCRYRRKAAAEPPPPYIMPIARGSQIDSAGQ